MQWKKTRIVIQRENGDLKHTIGGKKSLDRELFKPINNINSVKYNELRFAVHFYLVCFCIGVLDLDLVDLCGL